MTLSTRTSVPEVGGRLYGFPPAADANARVLILGSMPSEASLKAGAYYAHPRNRFWPVMGELLGFAPELPYAERIQALKDHRIALWDTIGSCERTGSLDSAILRPEVNPLGAFLDAHSGIRLVCLNGSMSEKIWRTFALPQIDESQRASIRALRMPSTSPANARWRLEDLARVWGEALLPMLSPGL